MEFRFYLQPVTRLDKQVSGSKLLSGVHSPFYNKENELIPEINSSKVMLKAKGKNALYDLVWF